MCSLWILISSASIASSNLGMLSLVSRLCKQFATRSARSSAGVIADMFEGTTIRKEDGDLRRGGTTDAVHHALKKVVVMTLST